MATDILKDYALAIRRKLRANPATPETGLAPDFQRLLERLLAILPVVPDLVVSPEYLKGGVGRPDIALIKQGEPPRAFIELKAPIKPSEPKKWTTPHDRRQYGRLQELSHWAASNFADFHLFERDRQVGRASVVPASALDPDTPDKHADTEIEAHDSTPFLELLGQLARSQPPAATNPQQLAELLAHSARIVRSAVEERVNQLDPKRDRNDPLMLVRQTYRNVLYAHPEAGGYSSTDFDELFASAFAQTLAFGLLLVREYLANTETDAQKQKVDERAAEHMPPEHPLMKGTLEAISHPAVIESVGIGFTVMLDTLNSFDPAILKPRKNGQDPILYFYEDFLSVFDPAARERYGVYYTPLQVVRFMVGALDRVLRDDLGAKGLHDESVTILDPATGTGTFLLGIAERVRDRVMEEEGGPAASLALKSLAGRMFGFELLIGPYAVAHYRLHHALSNRPPDDGEEEPQPVELPRLGIYLTDTLSRPDAITPMGQLGIQGIPIDEERERANEIKTRERILAIIGNPPYRRLEEGEDESLVGRWMNEEIWPDLKKPVSDAGKGGQLNTFPELSVAFWRWAIWKLFEAENAPKKGVIAFITNRKYLTGWPYAGLRKMMRERFDRLEIIDLRGDVRAGVRGNVANDQGVFNIMVGTAICIAVADGTKAAGALAEVLYRDSWEKGVFSKKAKLDWLEGMAGAGECDELVAVDRDGLDDFRPLPFATGDWTSLAELFEFRASGIETTRDHIAYGFDGDDLQARIKAMQELPMAKAKKRYSQSRKERFHTAYEERFDSTKTRDVYYRPLNRMKLYNSSNFVDWPRPALQKAWGEANIALWGMAYATGSGPATWVHGLLPDRHAFKGAPADTRFHSTTGARALALTT